MNQRIGTNPIPWPEDQQLYEEIKEELIQERLEDLLQPIREQRDLLDLQEELLLEYFNGENYIKNRDPPQADPSVVSSIEETVYPNPSGTITKAPQETFIR